MTDVFQSLKPGPAPKPITLRVEILNIEPLIWRRIVVSNHSTLATLHNYLQWVLGWEDRHAHEFHVGHQVIAPAWWISEMALASDVSNFKDESRVSVAKVVGELGIGGTFEYHYDMGDGWEHRLVIETLPSSSTHLPLPRCIAGENACPPEDVGGPPGYAGFLQCIADATHEEHIAMLEWVGGAFDPKGFDLNRINRDRRPGGKQRRG
jgi:hypothetical protein